MQLLRQTPADLARVARRQLRAHIDKIHLRQRLAAVAVLQPHQLQAPALRGVVGFCQRRGRSEQQQGIFHRSALFGDVVGIVPGGGLTLVGMLLLLVHDDQPDILQRGKHRAAGTHHDVGISLLDAPPLQKALGIVERRVLHRQPAAEGGF